MTEQELKELEREISKEATKASVRGLGFMKTVSKVSDDFTSSFHPSSTQKESHRILDAAAQLASNENPALYGGQLEFNMAVSEQVGLMMKHRSSAIGDATFSELVQFAYAFMRIVKGKVLNSDDYIKACASLGTAAECAAKESKQ